MHYSKLIIMLLAIIAMGACSNKAEKAQMLYQQGEQLIKKDHKWTEAGEMLLGSLQLQDENEPTPLPRTQHRTGNAQRHSSLATIHKSGIVLLSHTQERFGYLLFQ